MTTAATEPMTNPIGHPHGQDHDDHGHGGHESHSVFGFWLYLMTDCILFGSFFITYIVLHGHTDGGPTSQELFELPFVLVETFILLVSSCTFGFAMLAMYRRKTGALMFWMLVTFVLGAAFVGMELHEFSKLIAEGAGPSRSAFLSAFFSLVGLHGLHVTAGLLWILVMLIQVGRWGVTPQTTIRLSCLSLFWHFLDIVWICVFSFVYLMGSL